MAFYLFPQSNIPRVSIYDIDFEDENIDSEDENIEQFESEDESFIVNLVVNQQEQEEQEQLAEHVANSFIQEEYQNAQIMQGNISPIQGPNEDFVELLEYSHELAYELPDYVYDQFEETQEVHLEVDVYNQETQMDSQWISLRIS
jgi:hypothetical protein